MIGLTAKYVPMDLDGFIGIDRPRAILRAFIANPFPAAYLFVGPPGTGKTTAAFALAKALDGQPYHVASRNCNLEAVDRLLMNCQQAPMFGDFNCPIIDEIDTATTPAQLAFLSVLDNIPERSVFCFTCNSTKNLEPRFLSRCRVLKFESPKDAELTRFLVEVWAKESTAPVPDLSAIVKEAGGNVRAALMELETEILLAGSKPAPVKAAKRKKDSVVLDRFNWETACA